ncbi:DUF2318 domain-containing protein [Clostridium sp. LP20]|uniref:DUF2318 domain-containing protein n=1 Tax=Clostridium sp. LP20 TaxID=3418665 RepID=UPI003EE44570
MGTNKENNKGSKKQKGVTKEERNIKNGYEKPIILGILGVVLVIALVIAGNFLFGEKNNNDSKVSGTNSNKDESPKTSSANIEAGIEIKKEEVTEKAKFYSYEKDGITMEVLAVKAKDGTVRTALNTCQVCYSSGKGYYIQKGNELECQNCGNRFMPNNVGIAKGGCNPVPIPNGSKTDDNTTIKIDKSYLNKNKAYFSNWKA